MRWVFMRFGKPRVGLPPGQHIKPSFCHPSYWKVRAAYVFETYGAPVEKVERIPNLHLDFGGMIRTDDPCVELHLGTRTFSCWAHHASEALKVIEQSRAISTPAGVFHKFGRWPGVVCFISATDRRKLLHLLPDYIDRQWEMEQPGLMFENLVQCNVRPGLDADQIREAMLPKVKS